MYALFLFCPQELVLKLTHIKVYRTSWQYASSFSTSLSTASTESHIVALHQALIPNWTSPAFSKFVDACRQLVDELANTATAPNGKEEMVRCEEIFRQICWLEERFWPDVDGMGEEDESARLGSITMGPPGPVGSMDNGLNDSGLNNQGVNGSGMNGPMSAPTMGGAMGTASLNNGDGTTGNDNRSSFGGLETVGQSS